MDKLKLSVRQLLPNGDSLSLEVYGEIIAQIGSDADVASMLLKAEMVGNSTGEVRIWFS